MVRRILSVDDDQVSSLFRLCFLGSPVIVRHGRSVTELSPKAFILLAYLTLHDEPQSRERLMAMLWPASQEEAARKNLRNTLWSIRKALGAQVVQGQERLFLDKSLWIDLWAFKEATHAELALSPTSTSPTSTQDLHHYEEALALYQGRLLDGVNIVDASEVQVWLTVERERFEQIFLRVLLVLIDFARLAGKWSEVLELAYRALQADGLQESIYRVQMEAYARLGERGQAMRQYDMLRTILADELGVEPLPETESLRAIILRGELEPRLSDRPALSFPTAATARTLVSPPTDRPFIGRQREWTVLDEELQTAVQGQFRTVLISGELGIGKSRLWRVWSTVLEASAMPAMIIQMRALEVTRTSPFAPLLTWFNQSPWRLKLFSPTSLLSPGWQAEVLRLLPIVPGQRSDRPPLSLRAKGEERLRIFEAFAQCLLAIHQYDKAPIVFFLDDVQWSDAMTLQWLIYLSERLATVPILLLLAYRSEELSDALTAHIVNWKSRQALRHIVLQRFSEEEARALLARWGGDVKRRASAYSQSAGNPYFLIELLQAPADAFPSSLVALVRMRLAGLPEIVRQVLQAAAVLEPVIYFETLRRASGRGEAETLDALDSLLQAALLVEQKELYVFAHPLVAAIVRESLGTARRTVLHRRAAAAYEATMPVERLPLVAGQLAWHYQEADEREKAANYAEMAAEHARLMTDWDEVVRLYRQACHLAPTPLRLVRLSQALLEQADPGHGQADV